MIGKEKYTAAKTNLVKNNEKNKRNIVSHENE